MILPLWYHLGIFMLRIRFYHLYKCQLCQPPFLRMAWKAVPFFVFRLALIITLAHIWIGGVSNKTVFDVSVFAVQLVDVRPYSHNILPTHGKMFKPPFVFSVVLWSPCVLLVLSVDLQQTHVSKLHQESMRNIKCLILNIKRSSSLTWWSFETCICCKSTDKMRSTQDDHNTTEKTKGGLNIFPCVGSIMGIRTYIYKLHCKDTDVKERHFYWTHRQSKCVQELL